jgi:alpha-tubulin suppressor-like RCC1 family protein
MLAQGDQATKTAPVTISLGTRVIRDISCGGIFCMVVGTDNVLVGWGSNTGTIFADGTTTIRTTPSVVNKGSMPASKQILDIETTTTLSAIQCLLDDGNLWGWGVNTYGAVRIVFCVFNTRLVTTQ